MEHGAWVHPGYLRLFNRRRIRGRGVEVEKRIPLYYADQSGWGPREFNFLNSYLNRLFLYEADPEKSEQIASMDLSRMSRPTTALLGAILSQYGKLDALFEKYPNLCSDELRIPLETPLFLNEQPLNLFPAYRDMNIFY